MPWGEVEFGRTQRRKDAKGNVAKRGLETINVTPLMVEMQGERANLQNGIEDVTRGRIEHQADRSLNTDAQEF